MVFWVLLLCSLGIQPVILKDHIMIIFRVKEMSQARNQQKQAEHRSLQPRALFSQNGWILVVDVFGLEITWGSVYHYKEKLLLFFKKTLSCCDGCLMSLATARALSYFASV
jgi:hypothetical protein